MSALDTSFSKPSQETPGAVSTLEHFFTRDGSQALENQIRQICQWVMAGLRKFVPERKLQAVLLGGGYGRGEGGVLCVMGEDKLFNDLEFYVFISGTSWLNEKLYGEALHRLGVELGERAGIDVDFKILSLGKFRRSAASMFYYDLIVGHKWLYGEEVLLRKCEHHRVAGNIPLAEATRLLMNRCTGLLLIKEKIRSGRLELDFAVRNLAKLQLALGDALLTVCGRYHSSCIERGERVQKLQSLPDFPGLAAVQRHHALGVEFKLHPQNVLPNERELHLLLIELSDLALQVWLWLEQRRLGQTFGTIREYALSTINKCPETKWWRNWLVNVIRFGQEMVWRPSALRYPRERLYNTLPVLLWVEVREDDLKLLDHMQEQLKCFVTTPAELAKAYTELWEQFR